MAIVCPFFKQYIYAGTVFVKSNCLFIGSAVKEGQFPTIYLQNWHLLIDCFNFVLFNDGVFVLKLFSFVGLLTLGLELEDSSAGMCW